VAKKKAMTWLLGLIGIPALIVLAVLVAIIGLSAVAMGNLPGGDSVPSAYAARLIPPDMLALYQSQAVKQECPGLSWTIVAAIVHLESMDGRNPEISPAGAMGPSQFEPRTWDAQGRTAIIFTDAKGNPQPFGRVPDGKGYALDGDGDGVADIMNAKDSVPATARFLCANGGGNPATLVQAIYAYNHAWWYVFGGTTDTGQPFEGVLPLAQKLAANGSIAGTAVGNGEVLFSPGANFPGQPVTPETIGFLQVVAGLYGKPLICTTGTSHSYLTVDGLVSDHADGHACDFGMAANGGTDDGPLGDALDTACLVAAGDPPQVAAQEAIIGGLYTREHNGLRIQCIWKTDQGGNHHNHVHVGARPG
jgi:hypothetical protein